MLRCEKCGKEIKRNMIMHLKFCKGIAEAETNPPSVRQVGGSEMAPPSKFITYRSPRIKGLRIIVRPSFNRTIETPTGNYVTRVEGKVAEFKNGLFTTDDPEVIEFLDKFSRNKKNARYPIISSEQMREMGNTLRGR
jgi:hypothetical protein